MLIERDVSYLCYNGKLTNKFSLKAKNSKISFDIFDFIQISQNKKLAKINP